MPVDSPLAEPTPPVEPGRAAPSRIRRWTKILLTFAVGQSAIQGLNAVTGLLLIHWMSVSAYAQYQAAFAFQCSLAILVDLGSNTSVVPLVGKRGDDPALIGKYIRTVKALRLRMLLIIGAASAIVFPFVMKNQPWPFGVKVGLWAAVVSAVFFSANDVYRAPLLIHQQITKLYRTDIVPAIVRLVLSFGLFRLRSLFGWVAAWFSAFNYLQTAMMLRRAAKPYIAEPEQPDPEAAKEIISYLMPLIPGSVYYAFQGNIAISLVSYFGSTAAIAQTAALGRLGVIVTFLGSATTTLFVPMFARTSGRPLIKKVLIALVALSIPTVTLTILAFIFPKVFLILLGKNYDSLSHLVGWVVFYSSMTVIGTMLNYTCNAKKWVTKKVGWAPVVGMLAFQATYLFVEGVKTTQQAVGFQIITAASTIVVWGSVVTVNLLRERHRE